MFAWWHRPAERLFTHGILICPPIGHEQVHTHRALRHLAESLAASGFAVLRLDYHGTGDSDGGDRDPQRCATWQTNIHDATAWMREQGGCSSVSLIGLRFGATLAALHAAAHAVDNLILWSPVVSGRRYVRELKALSQTARVTANTGNDAVEAVGFVFTEETIESLSQIDLLKQQLRCHKALIVHSHLGSKDSPLFNHLESLGNSVEQQWLPGYEEMMAEPHLTEVPREAIASITQWLFVNSVVEQAHAETVTPTFAKSIITTGPRPVLETIHPFSSKPELFGIITEPVGKSTNLPWIVLLNSGTAHRVGPGRMHVDMAKQFADLGFPCLRLDLGGLGDSRAEDPTTENNGYASTAFGDIGLTCDFLLRQQPQRNIVLLGLCSGAYAAFQSAVQLPHPAIVESILLNPLTFFWQDGMSVTDPPTERLQAWHFYWSRLFSPTSWWRLISGKTTLGFTGAIRKLYTKLLAPSAPKRPATKPTATSGPGEFGHPAKDDLPADLERITSAGRTLALFVSDSDPGEFLLMHQAKRKATQLRRSGKLHCFTINNADHIFSSEASRQALYESLNAYLKQRFNVPQ